MIHTYDDIIEVTKLPLLENQKIYLFVGSACSSGWCPFSVVQQVAQYDLVINCTGLGSAKLFGDSTMYPIQGHVIRVRAPWVKGIYFCNEQTYIIPNEETVVRARLLYFGLLNIHNVIPCLLQWRSWNRGMGQEAFNVLLGTASWIE